MMNTILDNTKRLLTLLGHEEFPFGAGYSDTKPDGFGPKPGGELFGREREKAGLVDPVNAWKHFSCIMGNIWLARKKKKAAWLSYEDCGCLGGGLHTGMYDSPMLTNAKFISTGDLQNNMEGEHFLPSEECAMRYLESVVNKAPAKYAVFMPLDHFTEANLPLTVIFFMRAEALSGLITLARFATGDTDCIATPFTSACGSLLTWPLIYQKQGKEKAVLDGFDLSARKYMKTDELSLAMPLHMYQKMLDAMEDSSLTRKIWRETCYKKVNKSRSIFGE